MVGINYSGLDYIAGCVLMAKFFIFARGNIALPVEQSISSYGQFLSL
jgi:hypothetical protein